MAGARPPKLIDVRSEGEHAIAAIASSQLIPLSELSERVAEVDVRFDDPIVVYCHHGIRSRTGAAILEASGFTRVASRAGGIDAWSLIIDPAVKRY
ncbi:MAG: rhodanese-like domain-containing protein [Polyangiales bacterium]